MQVRMRFLLISGLAGATLAYLFDPVSGRRRRSLLRERPRVLARRGRRRSERFRRRGTATVFGVSRRATHLREARKPQPNDATLTQKVESEVFRNPELPKGSINVNAENGIVILRGEVGRPELVERLERMVRRVRGVRGVENLLHLPDMQAPMHHAHNGR